MFLLVRSILAGCTVPELRSCLAESKKARAASDAVDAQIVSLLEASLTALRPDELGTHEPGLFRREVGDVVRRAQVIEDTPFVGEALCGGALTASHVDAISRGLKIAGESRDTFLGLVSGLVSGLVESSGVMSVPEFTAEVMKAAKSVVTDGGLSTFEDQCRSTYLKIWNDATGMVNVRDAFDPEIGAVLQSRLQTQVETMFHSGDRDGMPLDIGRGQRLASAAQRRANEGVE